MRNLAVIPARSGSQRIKHKNIKLVAGHPLMYYQIECAKQVKEIQKIVVATDDAHYAEIATSLGADVVMRPESISGPDIKTEETLLYVIDTVERQGERFDNVILLQVTSPLNKPEYIREAINYMEDNAFNSALTYYEFMGFLLDDNDIIDRPMSQDRKGKNVETGCFWITNIEALKVNKNRICEPCALVKVPQIASLEVDKPEDLKIIEALIEPRIRKDEGKYFKKRTYHGDFEDGFYGPKLDPDGIMRDISKEKEDKIERCKEEVEFINKIASDGEKRNILDLGCGPGFASSAITNVYSKYGLEVSEKAATLAKKYIANVHVGRLEKDTYPEEFFDVVFCYHVIEHVEDPIEFVSNVRRIMKTHGHLIIGLPNFDSGAARRYGKNYRLLHDKSHISLFSSLSLKDLLEDYGFIVDRIACPFFETEYFTEKNLLRLLDSGKVSPPFYGNIMTFYGRKK